MAKNTRRAACTIRRATPADVGACVALVFAALREHGVEPEPQGADADVFGLGSRGDLGGRTVDLVAERPGGAIVGVACLEPWGTGGWISKLFVAPEARGEGLGRALLERLLDVARRERLTVVGLRTRTVFASAVRLYEAAGFTRADEGERGEPLEQRGVGEDRLYTLLVHGALDGAAAGNFDDAPGVADLE
ncbi:MAG: GNAT family N-acetyltransferase [Myxococcales bacterium]|nr:GNAT family N-acetyltransferase [Myxococcales bacterium]MBL0195261.1 GNAT family N-acetyltransferase [Myxococcales bacterium]HQY60157.1 GNAT family N-acetyltransferase [Polyangiaceae bacterium]